MVIMTIRGWLATVFMALVPGAFLIPGCGGDDKDEHDGTVAVPIYGAQAVCETPDDCSRMFGDADWICGENNQCDLAPAADLDVEIEEDDGFNEEYGPLSCNSNYDCEWMHGDGWLCDTDRHECYLPGDLDEDDGFNEEYGPQPCTTDNECTESMGSDWVCDVDTGACYLPAGDDDAQADADQNADLDADPVDEEEFIDATLYGPRRCGAK